MMKIVTTIPIWGMDEGTMLDAIPVYVEDENDVPVFKYWLCTVAGSERHGFKIYSYEAEEVDGADK